MHPFKKPLIMISNRDEFFCSECAEILADRGCDVEFLPFDSEKIIESVIKKEPDAVLIELAMPKCDGIGIIRAVKNYSSEIKTRFFVSVVFDGQGIGRAVLACGASYYFVAPLCADQVSERILDVLSAEWISLDNAESYESAFDYDVLEILKRLGISPGKTGYSCAKEAFRICVEYPEAINRLTGYLYPAVAERLDTTPTRVERAIRHAIESAIDSGNSEEFDEMFGHIISPGRGKPTNSEFIGVISERLTAKYMGRLKASGR